MATTRRAAGKDPAADRAAADALMAASTHPRKAEVEALRKVLREASPRLAERVKWNAPSVHVDGVDLAAFNLRQEAFVQLVLLFPRGVVDDPGVGLEGEWKDRRLARFDSMEDVRARKDALAALLRAMVARVEA